MIRRCNLSVVCPPSVPLTSEGFARRTEGWWRRPQKDSAISVYPRFRGAPLSRPGVPKSARSFRLVELVCWAGPRSIVLLFPPALSTHPKQSNQVAMLAFVIGKMEPWNREILRRYDRIEPLPFVTLTHTRNLLFSHPFPNFSHQLFEFETGSPFVEYSYNVESFLCDLLFSSCVIPSFHGCKF